MFEDADSPTTALSFPLQQNESRETLLGFNMVNYRACKNLWKACVEHHTFFRLERPIPPQKNFFAHYFTLGSKFRYWSEDTFERTEVPLFRTCAQ